MATFNSSGRDFFIFNVSVPASDTQVVINQKFNSCVIRCRTAIDMYLKRSQGDSFYFTIPAGSSLTLDVETGNLSPFSLQSSSGTVTAEIICYTE